MPHLLSEINIDISELSPAGPEKYHKKYSQVNSSSPSLIWEIVYLQNIWKEKLYKDMILLLGEIFLAVLYPSLMKFPPVPRKCILV